MCFGGARKIAQPTSKEGFAWIELGWIHRHRRKLANWTSFLDRFPPVFDGFSIKNCSEMIQQTSSISSLPPSTPPPLPRPPELRWIHLHHRLNSSKIGVERSRKQFQLALSFPPLPSPIKRNWNIPL